MGDSAGEPRRVSSPGLFAELFSAAVDYLGIQVPFVDREKIGVIGICGSGGFSLAAAAVDIRIKAVATASMYDTTDVRGMMDLSKDQLDQMKDELVQQRWEDYAKTGEPPTARRHIQAIAETAQHLPDQHPGTEYLR